MVDELAPSSSDLDLSYSFYRINRNLVASADTNAVVEDNELTQAERAELAKYWYVNPNATSDVYIQSSYLDTGSSSVMDESLAKLESEWEFMGGGNYNDNPLTFRYDQDYFYFLEFDDSLAGV